MSQPLNPQAKRRRLDNGASALSRPFKSPLPKSARQKEEPTNPDAAATQKTSTNLHKPSTPNIPNSPSLNIKTGTQSRHSNPTPESDPEIISLRRKRLTLQSQLTSLRSELDTAQQALRIESSSRDDELRALRLKWRGISQKAAEELFETAKDKIERMGGVAAWKESEKQRLKRMQMWEDDDFYAGGDGDRVGEREKGEDGFDDYDEGGSGQKEGDEEETFTMDMMLKSLNIEPDIIGFDMVEKRWKND